MCYSKPAVHKAEENMYQVPYFERKHTDAPPNQTTTSIFNNSHFLVPWCVHQTNFSTSDQLEQCQQKIGELENKLKETTDALVMSQV